MTTRAGRGVRRTGAEIRSSSLRRTIFAQCEELGAKTLLLNLTRGQNEERGGWRRWIFPQALKSLIYCRCSARLLRLRSGQVPPCPDGNRSLRRRIAVGWPEGRRYKTASECFIKAGRYKSGQGMLPGTACRAPTKAARWF